jgi:prophage endopeptidase
MSSLERILVGLIVLAGLLVLGTLGVRWYGAQQFDAGHAKAVSERAAADAVAVLRRTQENTVLAASQGATNLKITEAKHEEIQPVRERIVTQRVYVGSGICGPTAAPDAESAGGGDSADSPGRLVRSDIERDLVALKLAVEDDLATGRACQAFVRENGMVP